MDVTKALSLALPLVFDLEGCRLVAYLDTLARPPVWTIGHGSTWVQGKPVHYGMTCTRAEADLWAGVTLATTAEDVRALLKVGVTDEQWAACISLAYNIGTGAFRHSSVLEAINLALFQRAADRFLEYDHAGGRTVAGLTVRRARERALFLSGMGEPSPEVPVAAVPALPAATPAHPLRAPVPVQPIESEADLLNQRELDANRLSDPEHDA
jgi:GH24 family phage-related lysozyme (muramidase)